MVQELSSLEKEWTDKYDIATGRLKANLSEPCFEWARANGKITDELAEQKFRSMLFDCYCKMVLGYEKFMDRNGDETKLQAIWDIGTWFHKVFPTFPYLFVTATKGSGKSRLQKISSSWTWNGKLTAGMSDSALFRSCANHTLYLDEAESIGRKEKQAMREILNIGYKKGAKISRIKEKKNEKGEKTYVPDDFDVYGPKMICNIYGMEDVLGDRCITSILEKSNNPSKVRLMEDFDNNPYFSDIKRTLEQCSVYFSAVYYAKNNAILSKWNNYITLKYTILHTTFTNIELHNNTLTKEEKELFDKIDSIGLNGRHLELFFPLFIISSWISPQVLEEFLLIAKNKIDGKKEEELYSSKDSAVLQFCALQDNNFIDWIPVSELTRGFKAWYGSDEDNLDWVTAHWFSKALARMNLVLQRRRLGRGIDVILNVNKARDKVGKPSNGPGDNGGLGS